MQNERQPRAAKPLITLGVGSFANINGGPAFNAAASGLQYELVRDLAQDAEISVRSGTVEQPAVGDTARFGARFALSGSLQRVTGGMRIDAKLVDVDTGDHLWIERYEGEATPEFQHVVTGLIASQVRVNLMLGKFNLRDKAPADGPEVRAIVNSAIVCFFRQTPESLAEAITLSERALALDESSLRARRTLSASISASITLGQLPRSPENLDRARRLAQEVVEAVPHDEIARCEMAWALTNQARHAEAAEHLRVAVDLNPASPNARADLAEQLAIMGQAQEALEQIRLAMASAGPDPLEIWRHHTMSIANFTLGEYEAVLKITRRMIEAEPSFFRGVLFWAASAAALGLDEEAGRAVTHLRTIVPQFRMDDLVPTYWSRFVKAEHQERFEAMLRRAGLT